MDTKGNLTYRFHKTDIVVVKANGAIKLTTGGWFTATTMMSMNDVLHAVGVQVRCAGDPKEGNWTVFHAGRATSYHDDIVLEPSSSADQSRAQKVMQRALDLGIACFTYVKRVPATGGVAALPGRPTPPLGGQGNVGGIAAQSTAAGGHTLQAQSYQEMYAKIQGLSVQGAVQGKTGSSTVQPNPGTDDPAPKLTAEHYDSLLLDDVLDEDTACIACMEVARDTIIVPCGHLVLCQSCAKGITTCPMCRMAVSELISLA